VVPRTRSRAACLRPASRHRTAFHVAKACPRRNADSAWVRDVRCLLHGDSYVRWSKVSAIRIAAATRQKFESRARRDCATENIETIAVGLSVLYLPRNLTRAEARFVTVFAANHDLHIIAGLTGVQRGDEGVQRTLELLGVVAGPAPTIATASHIVTASDADDEVRCVVRDVVATLSQTPAHRVALLYSAAAPYARLLHEQLAAATITVNGTSSRTIDERAVARAFLEVLALVEHDVPRAELFRALANAPTRDFTGARLPVARWERISRTAGVVGGEDWANRLDSYIEEQRARAEIERSAEDSQRWLVERCVAEYRHRGGLA
jgi:ATP-dependent helicase/nuclease subunit B